MENKTYITIQYTSKICISTNRKGLFWKNLLRKAFLTPVFCSERRQKGLTLEYS